MNNIKNALLVPCQQWICDTCKTLIRNPEEGELQYLINRNDNIAFSFRIIHDNFECDQWNFSKELDVSYASIWLNNFQEDDGFEKFLVLMQNENIEDFHEYFTLLRRLFVPYYEQARLFLKQATDERFFIKNGFEEPYPTEVLKSIIEHYNSL